jgi:putative PIN family toxin of toxin-antitoxin system
MNKLRIVLDTNVLIAANRSRLGASFALLQYLRAQKFVLLVSVPLFLEYESVLKRSEQLAIGNRNEAMVDGFLNALTLRVEPVHLFYLWRPQLTDPADEMVLETALNGRADALVTYNVKDFVAASRFNLPVWTPQQLLLQLQENIYG